MLKMIVGLFIGMILTGILFMGPLSLIPMIAQSDGPGLTETPVGNAEIYRKAIISSLQEAGEEIQDSDTERFYWKLIRGYELGRPSPGTAQAEGSSPTEVLPDIKKINHRALTLPLQEAGRNIQDEETAQFYYKLMKDAGWTIESN
jgi:hypothetical protein